MPHIQSMLQAHPRRPQGDVLSELANCVEACYDCASTCTACADACLGEQHVQDLVRCIRLNLDCADICETTGNMLVRMTEPDIAVLRAQLEACIQATRACADECDRHASMHEHCRVCAESCRRCADMCQRMLQQMMAGSSTR